ncbi:hypothetical protein EN804_04610 [Mesorhizobium sp. M8A.F.Ca.ET.161.01.1.1]|nr:hypothetical protein EN804_04610 [Mesorhizobium sp. M8A.F.Ca.ET.161.01.1.1]TGV45353.1 hypothetical protein EN785_04605 [Mesorhizobium sp. M8A.F.Ca.ET.142.01.1.1]TGW07231.1 hypothetical protein EN788_37900 [Mesorhizobium sp. M2D.F.Ca.ET.145.01.1.1]
MLSRSSLSSSSCGDDGGGDGGDSDGGGDDGDGDGDGDGDDDDDALPSGPRPLSSRRPPAPRKRLQLQARGPRGGTSSLDRFLLSQAGINRADIPIAANGITLLNFFVSISRL